MAGGIACGVGERVWPGVAGRWCVGVRTIRCNCNDAMTGGRRRDDGQAGTQVVAQYGRRGEYSVRRRRAGVIYSDRVDGQYDVRG